MSPVSPAAATPGAPDLDRAADLTDLALQAARESWRPSWAWLFCLAVPLFGYPVLIGDPKVAQDPLTVFAKLSPLLDGYPMRDALTGLRHGLNPLNLLLAAWLTSGVVAWCHAKSGWDGRKQGPTPRTLVRASRGLFLSTLALMLTRMALGTLALLVLASLPIGLLPDLSGLGPLNLPLYLGVLGIFGLGLLYVLTVDAACWLGLQSLAANRRGAASAYQHAWRLLSNDPAKATRVVGIYGAVIGLGYGVLLPFLERWWGESEGLVMVVLRGLLGWWAARYWLLSYTALGGIQTASTKPGDSAAAASGAPQGAAPTT